MVKLGLSYLPSYPEDVEDLLYLVDFIEMSPDTLCREIETPQGPKFHYVPSLLERAMGVVKATPVVVHGVELSIGTYGGWNHAYIEILDQFWNNRKFMWHSEHLAFQTAFCGGTLLNAGVQLPLPHTDESVDVVAPRARALKERYGVPFLLENATFYLPDMPSADGWDEVVFLNRILETSGCDLLLDLFNLYCNSRNFGFDPISYLSRLRLDRVVEIHVAGGETHQEFLLDSHSGEIPEEVLALLDWVIPKAPRLLGVVYEIIEQAYPSLGRDFVTSELNRVKERLTRSIARSERVYLT
jgi:uncharacterized protein (UPF0276 family)